MTEPLGTLTREVVLTLLPGDPAWLWNHSSAQVVEGTGPRAVDERRTITMAAGTRPSRELAWLVTSPVHWSDGKVPTAVPAGLAGPTRMYLGGRDDWWNGKDYYYRPGQVDAEYPMPTGGIPLKSWEKIQSQNPAGRRLLARLRRGR